MKWRWKFKCIWFWNLDNIYLYSCAILVTDERKVSIWFTVHYSRFRIQHLVQYSGYYSKYGLQRLVQDLAYYSKMSRVLFSVWFSIQGLIENMTCSVWFRIQRIIKKCPGYYSASGSVFRVLFKIRPATSGWAGFSVLLKNGQGII